MRTATPMKTSRFLSVSLLIILAAAPVSAAPRSPQSIAAEIDASIEKVLAGNKVPLSPKADDAEFLRRASLDIRGRVPTAERTIAFLKDTNPDKRAKLIDELLSDNEYGEHFAIIWYHRMVRLDDDNRLLVAKNG